MLLTVLVLVTLIFALYILIYGELIVETTLSYNNVFLGREYTFSEIWFGWRWIIALILFFFMSYSIYFILPRSGASKSENDSDSKRSAIKDVFSAWFRGRRVEMKRALPGSIFSAVAMLIATWIITLYMRNFQNFAFGTFSILYGGLSSVVVLLLWFYVIAFIVITGIQVNATCAELEAEPLDGGEEGG
jgi:membrane protein